MDREKVVLKRRPTSTMKIVDEKTWLAALRDSAYRLDFRHAMHVIQPTDWIGVDEVMPDHLVFMVESGAVEGWVGSVAVCLEKGDAVWIVLGVRRHFRCPPGADRTRTRRIRFALYLKREPLSFSRNVLLGSGMWRLLMVHGMMCDRAPGQAATWFDAELRALLALCWIQFQTHAGPGPTNRSRTLDVDVRRRVEACMRDRLLQGLTPAELACEAGFCLDYFSRLFRNTYGLAPRGYLLSERLNQAAALLLDSRLRVNEVCRAIGETDPCKFNRQFRKQFGCTPGVFRSNTA